MTAPAHEIDAVVLSPKATPGFIHSDNLKEASAKKASELLTANHNLYHNRWKDTFHNHTVHHILSLWSLGATPDEMQDMYDFNEIYQAPIGDLHKQGDDDASKNLDMSDPQTFQDCLGKNEYYADYLNFFKQEMTKHGMRAVLKEYVFKGDSRADDIVARLFSDLLHPMIHLGCAIEFNQPSIAAEALAAACVHHDWPSIFLAPTKELAQKSSSAEISSKPLLELIHEMSQDELIADGVRDTDPFNRIPDGFLKRVTKETLAPYLSSYRVEANPEAIQASLADLLHSLSYMLASTQRPGKTERMDFVLLHCMTLSVHFPAIMAQDWISDEEKARMLETKARVDAVMYSGCRCPPMYGDRIKNYVPKNPNDGWPELIQRAIVYKDEGHAAKLIRGLLVQKSLAIPQTSQGKHQVWMNEEDILTVGHMAMDALEVATLPGGSHMPEHVGQAVVERIGKGGEMIKANMQRWVYYGGLEKAWDFVPMATSS